MTVSPTISSEVALAHAFARAYREVDENALRDLIAPNAQVRMLMPRGYSEHTGPEALIEQLRGFFAKWPVEAADEPQIELLRPNVMKTGVLTQVGHRLRLRQADAGHPATMVITHLLAIADGRIAVVDELCTGLMPEPA